MAEAAISIDDGRMNPGVRLFHLLRESNVAIQAEVLWLLLELCLDHTPVGIMTGGAVPLCRRMGALYCLPTF